MLTPKDYGINVPESLIAMRTAAVEKLDQLKKQIAELEEKANTDVSAFPKELALAVADGKGLANIEKRHAKITKEKQRAEAVLVELKRLLPGAEAQVEVAEQGISAFVGERQVADRKEQKEQLDVALLERGRSMSQRQDGRMVSAPPEKDSVSNVCACEHCYAEVATLRADACQPMTAACFKDIHGEGSPFLACEPGFFKCPFCSKMPWGEHDRVFTTAGFRMLPMPEEPEVEEPDTFLQQGA